MSQHAGSSPSKRVSDESNGSGSKFETHPKYLSFDEVLDIATLAMVTCRETELKKHKSSHANKLKDALGVSEGNTSKSTIEIHLSNRSDKDIVVVDRNIVRCCCTWDFNSPLPNAC